MRCRMVDETYGWEGPYEAESKEELVELMRPTFEDWALEHWGLLEDEEKEQRDKKNFIESAIEQMEEEYYDALEETEE